MINLTSSARIRFVVGFLAITLGLMDLINPSVSSKWKWFREWMISVGGEYGYAVLLLCIGTIFLIWAILESLSAKGGSK